jgi:AraC family transcriptional regulator of adaptative response/methylated-DNA-[protein]-cysteine methyltransferase
MLASVRFCGDTEEQDAARNAGNRGGSVTKAILKAELRSTRGTKTAPAGQSPARFAAGGRGEQIGYAAQRSPFGWMIVGATERGLCWLSLAGTKAEADASLRAEFPLATLKRDASLAGWIEAALAMIAGQTKPAGPQLDLRGTAFQLRVWQELRKIPRGQKCSYSQLARELGAPNSTRAVARACAMNRVALVVPCHRVVGASGALTGYRWGVERKRMLLEAESE